MSIDGIDISYANPHIDFKKVRKSGIGFVIIRTGYKQKTDTHFKEHIEGALEAGLDVGVYCYCMAKTTAQAKKEAQYVAELIKPYKLTYPVFYDMEDKSIESLPQKTLTDIALSFMKEIKAEGYRTGLYANPSWLLNRLERQRLDCDIWLAHWTQSPEKKTSYDFGQKLWQWGTRKIDGIEGEVDADISYIDFSSQKQSTTQTLTTLSCLNMRSCPCLSGELILTIPTGQTVTRIGNDKITEDGYCWYRVRYNGKEGFCAEKYLYRADKCSVFEATDALNLRKLPTTDSKALSVLHKGEKIVAISKRSRTADGYKWLKVSNGDYEGFCACEYLRKA